MYMSMRHRVREVLSSDAIKLIQKKEKEGIARQELIEWILLNKDSPLESLIESYDGEQRQKDLLTNRGTDYRALLVEALMTEISLKEDIEKIQLLLEQEEREV